MKSNVVVVEPIENGLQLCNRIGTLGITRSYVAILLNSEVRHSCMLQGNRTTCFLWSFRKIYHSRVEDLCVWQLSFFTRHIALAPNTVVEPDAFGNCQYLGFGECRDLLLIFGMV